MIYFIRNNAIGVDRHFKQYFSPESKWNSTSVFWWYINMALFRCRYASVL